MCPFWSMRSAERPPSLSRRRPAATRSKPSPIEQVTASRSDMPGLPRTEHPVPCWGGVTAVRTTDEPRAGRQETLQSVQIGGRKMFPKTARTRDGKILAIARIGVAQAPEPVIRQLVLGTQLVEDAHRLVLGHAGEHEAASQTQGDVVLLARHPVALHELDERRFQSQ